jgi:YggT family protein
VISATEPILAPIRRSLPRTGMLDLSPLIVLIVLSVLWRFL